jgi:ADP-ribose pyrophosphatase
MNATVKAEPVITTLLETDYFNVIDVDGYKIVKEPQAVNGVIIFGSLPNKNRVLIDLNRRAVGKVMRELPRGKIDLDNAETPEQAAIREFSEETGMEATDVRLIGHVHSNTSLIASSVAVCVVETDGVVRDKPDGEADRTVIASDLEIMGMMVDGTITDGHTLSAMMLVVAEETMASRNSA